MGIGAFFPWAFSPANEVERSTIPLLSGVMATRWLDDDERATWRAFLAATHLLMDRLDRELQSGVGIPHAYYEILVRLSEAPGRAMRMSDLAERCHSSRSRLSHAVRRLEEDGWVRRAPLE